MLGELLAGFVLGNLPLVGVDALGFVGREPAIDILARLGVIILLFEVSLESTVRELIQPISSFLVPVFFVVMGARVDLASLARPGILGLAAALTVAAILGKQACALGAIGGRLDRLSIALGMMPRGEVGLIFASIGVGLMLGGRPVVDAGVFAAVVIMVLLTTVVTPPALKWSLARGRRAK